MTILEEKIEEFTEQTPQQRERKMRTNKIYIPGPIPGDILKLAAASWSKNRNELISNRVIHVSLGHVLNRLL
jgi:hypothetical protein